MEEVTQTKLEKITEASGSRRTGGIESASLSLYIQPETLSALVTAP